MNQTGYERVEDARMLLENLGFDAERSNERSALVFLALLHLRPADEWSAAASPMLGTRAIMDWIRDHYGVAYAANTRETIRRFTLHQFADAMLVQQNPDDPKRPINSPKWCYQVHPRAVRLIRTLGSDEFGGMVEHYLRDVPGLRALYEAAREMDRIPVTLPDGSPVTLSPGGQNVLIKQMVEDFCGYFTPGGVVLYVGDADDKWSVCDRDALGALGVEVDEHGKMPDLVVHLAEKNCWSSSRPPPRTAQSTPSGKGSWRLSSRRQRLAWSWSLASRAGR